jgi:glucosamine--fructose-6-phosphate aminotransferase (isomerizing)
VEGIAAELDDADHLFVVGGGLAYPAALEAALKLKEMALVHAEASETWEMASGPATMVGPSTVVVSLAPDGAARAATDDVVRHCRQWGARVIEVTPSRTVNDSRLLAVPAAVDERFAPLTMVPPVALLAYVLAGRRGATPDRPSWTERYRSQGLNHIVGVS